MICTKTNKRILQNTVYKNSKIGRSHQNLLATKSCRSQAPDAIVVAKNQLAGMELRT
jgi:hypothetical protein